MSERDTDIEFDFFEEEPPTQESSRPERRDPPRRSRRAPPAERPAEPHAALRLVGLVAFAILIVVLLVFWVKSCQAASKEKTYKSYMAKVSEVADSSEQIGKQLTRPCSRRGSSGPQLEQQIAGLAQQRAARRPARAGDHAARPAP